MAGYSRLLVKSVYQKIFFLFPNRNICCGYSKEPSQWDGSFENPNHMLKLMGKNMLKICVYLNLCIQCKSFFLKSAMSYTTAYIN